jgi:hypothetical protein
VSLSQTLRNLTSDSLLQYQGLTYAKVVKFNSAKYTADIEFQKTRVTKTGKLDYPKAYNIPIAIQAGNGYYIRGKLIKDDVVIVAFAVSEIDKNGGITSDRAKFLSKDNCVILGALVSENPDSDGDIVIGSATSKIEINSDGITMTNGAVTFVVDTTGATVTVGGLTVNLFTHVHPTAAAGPPSPPTPGT